MIVCSGQDVGKEIELEAVEAEALAPGLDGRRGNRQRDLDRWSEAAADDLVEAVTPEPPPGDVVLGRLVTQDWPGCQMVDQIGFCLSPASLDVLTVALGIGAVPDIPADQFFSSSVRVSPWLRRKLISSLVYSSMINRMRGCRQAQAM